MIVRSLAPRDLADRLDGPGLAIRTGPFVVRIGTSLPELAQPIGLLYSAFRLAEEEPIPDFSVRVDPAPSPVGRLRRRAVTYVDGQRAFDPYPRRQALAMLEWSINWCVFTRPNHYLLLHAAVVAREDRALILSGKPGVGKSTLTAALVLRGWRLLSDEVGVVRPGSDGLIPVPRPVGLKERSIEIIRAFEPSAVFGPPCVGTRKGTVAHLRPPESSVDRSGEPAIPAWIVFPRYASGARSELRPMPRTEAFLHVANESFNYSLLGATGFETLATVVERCSCHAMPFGGLEHGVDLLSDLVGVRDSAPPECVT